MVCGFFSRACSFVHAFLPLSSPGVLWAPCWSNCDRGLPSFFFPPCVLIRACLFASFVTCDVGRCCSGCVKIISIAFTVCSILFLPDLISYPSCTGRLHLVLRFCSAADGFFGTVVGLYTRMFLNANYVSLPFLGSPVLRLSQGSAAAQPPDETHRSFSLRWIKGLIFFPSMLFVSWSTLMFVSPFLPRSMLLTFLFCSVLFMDVLFNILSCLLTFALRYS